MLIGENFRKQRLNKGLTQEQLAAVFGVSAQAVSRWENDTAYPDITLLPGMASFYGISVDVLLGVDDVNRQQILNQIHCEVHALLKEQKSEQAVSLLQDGLKRYPNNSGLLIELCGVLAAQDSSEAIREAIVIGERILQNHDVSHKARSTVMVTLIYLYRKIGETQSAAEMVSALPHIWESREILLAEAADSEVLKQVIRQTLMLLCEGIRRSDKTQIGEIPSCIGLGISSAPMSDTKELLKIIEEFIC